MVIESINPSSIVLNDEMPGVNRSFISASCLFGLPLLFGCLIDDRFNCLAALGGFGFIFLVAWASAKFFLGPSATYTFDRVAGDLHVRRKASVMRVCALSDIVAVTIETDGEIGRRQPRRLLLRLSDGSIVPVPDVYTSEARNEFQRAHDAIVKLLDLREPS